MGSVWNKGLRELAVLGSDSPDTSIVVCAGEARVHADVTSVGVLDVGFYGRRHALVGGGGEGENEEGKPILLGSRGDTR